MRNPRRGLLPLALVATTTAALLAGCSSSGSSSSAGTSEAMSPAGAGAASAGAASGGASSGAAGNVDTLTVIESTPGFFALPFQVAVDQYASQYNLKVKVDTVNGGGALGTEFQGGTADVALVGVDTPLRLAEHNSISGGVTILGTNMSNMLYALVSKKGSKYTSLPSLKGQHVAVTGAGAASQVVLNWALLNQAHMKISDVKEVPLGSPPTILAAVEKGSVAAGTIFSPALEEGLQSNQVQIAFDFRKYPYAQNVFVGRTNEIKANPRPYKELMQAYDAAVAKLESDNAFALQMAKKYWGKGATEDILKAELQFYLNDEWKTTEFTQDLYNASKDVLLKSGSGFPAANFPSYESVTKDAPKVG